MGVQKANAAVFDLYTADGAYKKAIADAFIAGDLTKATALKSDKGPLLKLNEIFRLSNLAITLDGHTDQLMASRNGSQPYTVPRLSDGERGALLLGAVVLTAAQGSLFLIDEPERHLHRSIVTPLLRLLFKQRPDCGFVVSTHEVDLPSDFPGSRSLLVRSCVYQNELPRAWTADELLPSAAIDEATRRDVLGARRKLVFVEGTQTSLDTPMYALLFPGVSISPRNNSNDIEKAVVGLTGAAGVHWLKAFGIVDGDGRTPAENTALRNKGIYAVGAYSVESIYYHPKIQEAVALYKTGDASKARALTKAAAQATVAKVRQHIDNLALLLASRVVRQSIMSQLPTHTQLGANPKVSITQDATQFIAEEKKRLTAACDNGAVTILICRYKVRSTGALDEIATKLGFKNTADYEANVLDLLQKEAAAMTLARSFLGTLYADLSI